MTSRRPISISSSPPSSPPESDQGEEPSTLLSQSGPSNTREEFKRAETPSSQAEHTRGPNTSKLTGLAADNEKNLRHNKYQHHYDAFLEEAKLRRMQRRDLEARNKLWQESRDKAQARVEAIDKEKEELLQKIRTMGAAQEAYNAENAVAVSEEKDVETKRKWEAYFNLETDSLGL